jgi:phosphate uptake regulator
MVEEIEQSDNEIRLLADRIVDLGVYVEEMFKNAISLLFTRNWSSVLTIFQSEPDILPVTLIGDALNLIKKWNLMTDRLRTVMALQQAATEFEAILRIIGRVAERVDYLEDDIESYFIAIGPRGHQSFFRLVNSAYVQLRGCVVALSTRQPSIAARVIEQDSVLDQAYLEMQITIKQALAADVSLSLPLASISVIIGDIEQLGNHITRICQRVESIAQGSLFTLFDFDPAMSAAM